MNRDYEDGVRDDVNIFIGNEVEHTPAYGKKTLFVAGIHPAIKLASIAKENNCDHIYLGANHSYSPHDWEAVETWEILATFLLDEGFWVTLDVDSKFYDITCDSFVGLCSYNNFIPMISVKLPYLTNLNYNACIKIDDKDFKASNPGIWVHQLHDLMDRKAFTDWSQYGKDKAING